MSIISSFAVKLLSLQGLQPLAEQSDNLKCDSTVNASSGQECLRMHTF